MSHTIRIKPKAGFQIVDPETRDRLPPEGRTVNDSPYWQRRITDGDVILIPKESE